MSDLPVACVDGEVSPLSEAKVPLDDRGAQFGHALFETLLIDGNGIVAWNDHMARLLKGCQKILIEPPAIEILKEQVIKTIREHRSLNGKSTGVAKANGRSEASVITNANLDTVPQKLQVRIMVSAGSSLTLPVHRNSKGELKGYRVSIICRAVPQRPEHYDSKGLNLWPVQDARSVKFLETKSSNYLWNILALDEAMQKNRDDAVFFNEAQHLTECTTSNFLWVNSNDKICGAPVKGNCLPGTSLAMLKRALIKKGHQYHDIPLLLNKLSEAQACFVISSVRGLTPVGQIGDHVFPVEEFEETAQYLGGLLKAEQETSKLNF
jgi:branched-subunit amino acid aminotransferase/4-amino-4-deoxychorismate lyase